MFYLNMSLKVINKTILFTKEHSRNFYNCKTQILSLYIVLIKGYLCLFIFFDHLLCLTDFLR